jgi:hypothetical protein
MNVRAATAVFALGTLSAIVAVRSARAGDDGKTAETKTYTLSPSFTVGERFRVERRYRQTTLTTYGAVGGRGGGRGGAGIDPLAYDASTQVEALVTVEKVSESGAATEWSAMFEKLRVDIPDPIQTQAYRLRQRERKQKRLVPNAHPLEGATLKVEQKGEKSRLYKVLKSGEDAGVTQRYPEVVPIMQSLVDPDWAAAKPMAVGAEWDMPADQIFRMTKVLARTPLEGTIKCRLASVEEGTANIDFTATLSETFATATMKIEVAGRIEFDVEKRRVVGSSYKGDVEVTAKGSSLNGRGVVEGGSTFSTADAPAGED